MVRTLMKHSAVVRVLLFLFLKHFGVICDLLLNRRTVAGNPFVLCGPWKRSVDGAMRFPNHRHIIQEISLEIIFLNTKRQESFIVYNSSKLSLNCLSGTLKVFVFVKIAESKLTWTVEAISVKSLLTNTEIRAISVVAISPVMALSEILLTLVYICWINS